jgi:GNAT superfamily N-acetyltransferase
MAAALMPNVSLALPLNGARVRIPQAEDDDSLAIVRKSDGQVVGRLKLSSDAGVLIVQELCVTEQHRGYGCGSDAGRLLVHAAEAAGFKALRAWAPPDRGLAVYFWFRMGLRPLHGEGPSGGLWLECRYDRPR